MDFFRKVLDKCNFILGFLVMKKKVFTGKRQLLFLIKGAKKYVMSCN